MNIDRIKEIRERKGLTQTEVAKSLNTQEAKDDPYFSNAIEELNSYKGSEKKKTLIYNGIKYLVINSDIDFKENVLPNIETNIITFGLNHLATVTFSSVTDENILISVQRNFSNSKGNTIDVGEYSIAIEKLYRNYIYEVLACLADNLSSREAVILLNARDKFNTLTLPVLPELRLLSATAII